MKFLLVFSVATLLSCTTREEGDYVLSRIDNVTSTDEANFPAEAWKTSVLTSQYKLSLQSTESFLGSLKQKEPHKIEREAHAVSFALIEADELLVGELRFSGTLQGSTVQGSLERVWNLSGNHVKLSADVTFEKQ